jgi:hypothetical protein
MRRNLWGEPDAVQQAGHTAERVADVEHPPDEAGDAGQSPALILPVGARNSAALCDLRVFV